MSLPKFEDLNAFNIASAYPSTNEEPAIHRMLLSKRRFKRAGGISGGGDVPLFVLLPKCKELVVVDHSYRSLAFAYMKMLLLEKMGGPQLRAFLFEKTHKDLLELVKDVYPQLPAPLGKFVSVDPTNHSYTTGHITLTDYNEIRREFYYVSPAVLKHIHKWLGRITLVHGDLTDLAKYGPFDCLYVSNAFQHSGRIGTPTLKAIEPLVGKRALVLLTGTHSPSRIGGRDWETLRIIRGVRSGWDHQLLRRKPPVPPPVPPTVAAEPG